MTDYSYVHTHAHPDGGECVAELTLQLDEGSIYRVPDRCPECGEALDVERITERAETQAAHDEQNRRDWEESMRGVNPDFRDL